MRNAQTFTGKTGDIIVLTLKKSALINYKHAVTLKNQIDSQSSISVHFAKCSYKVSKIHKT